MSPTPNPDLVILGAGIAGLAAAYLLAAKHQLKNIVIVDERPPLGLTSSRGTMAYRNWFPGPGDAMVRLMNRSIDLMQAVESESPHGIQLSQNGYMYFTADPSQIGRWRELGLDGQARGVGQFREHADAQNYVPTPLPSRANAPDGVDLLTNPQVIHQFYPEVTKDATALLHVRRAGAFDVFALGDWLLTQAQANGAQLLRARVERISMDGSGIQAVHLSDGQTLSTRTLVVAAGPLLPEIARMLDLELPVYGELHAKITLADSERVFPRYGDLLYWSDAQTLDWSEQERQEMSAEARGLQEEIRGGVHYLPKGTSTQPIIMGLWTYDIHETPYRSELKFNPYYPEIVLRGLARLIPEAQVYIGRGTEAFVDGGYYCKTRENRPLIGPLPIQGAYIIGAFSGYGVMAALGAAELVTAHILDAPLPEYAQWFELGRYEDPEYEKLLKDWEPRSGQL